MSTESLRTFVFGERDRDEVGVGVTQRKKGVKPDTVDPSKSESLDLQ